MNNGNGTHAQPVTKKQVTQAFKATQSLQLMGHCIYWGSMTGVDITYADFIALLNRLEIDKEVAREIRLKSAANKAVRLETKGRKDTFHRKVADEKDVAAFVIANTTVDQSNRDVNFQTETKAVYNKDTEKLHVEGVNGEKILANFEKFKDRYDGDHLRNVVLNYIHKYCEGISLRERGGIYFVPIIHQDKFEKLESLLGHFNIPFNVLPVVDDQKSKKAAWDALDADVRTELAELQEDVEGLTKSTSQKISDKLYETRTEKYKKLKAKIENYEILLTGKADSLKEKLNEITLQMQEKLTK